MALQPYELPPGIQVPPTKASKSVYWAEGNLIRWVEGKMAPFNGWEKLDFSDAGSNIRAVHRWEDLSGVVWTAYLTDDNCYVELDGELLSVAPLDMASPFSGGLAGGYGDDSYSYGEYGTPRPFPKGKKGIGPAFSFDNWGEDLLFMTSTDGRLLRWSPSTPSTKASQVPTSPLGRCFSVTLERFVLIFDYGGSIGQFAWCNQEDIENWNFADLLSKAGDLPIEPRAQTVGVKRVEAGVFVSTTLGNYTVEFIGSPLMFSIDSIAGGTPPITAQSYTEVSTGLLWPSDSGWWIFNGVSISPLPCPVWSWIESHIDWDLARLTACSIHNSWYSEVWWSFPEKGATGNTLTVVFNYRDGWWSMARLGRSAGSAGNYLDFPIMADGKVIYRHETGDQYAGSASAPWIESHTINAGGGSNLMTVRQMQPDIEGESDAVGFRLIKKSRRGLKTEILTPVRTTQPNGFVDFMETGLDFRLRIEALGGGVRAWTVGASLLDIVGRGKSK